MRCVLADLDEQLKILLVDDDTILDFHKLPFDKNALGKLRQIVELFKPDKLIYITHNSLVSFLYKEMVIAFDVRSNGLPVLSTMNTQDANILVELGNQCGVRQIKFVDKIGYYASFGDNLTCYSESFLGLRRLYCFDGDGEVHSTVCALTSGEAQAEKFVKTYMLNTVTDTKNLYDISNLMCFMNASVLLDSEEDFLTELSVFAYAYCTNDQFCYDSSVLNRTDVNVLNARLVDGLDKLEFTTMNEEAISDDLREQNVRKLKSDTKSDKSRRESKQQQITKVQKGRKFKETAEQKKVKRFREGKKPNELRRVSLLSAAVNVGCTIAVALLLLSGGVFTYNRLVFTEKVQNDEKTLEANNSLVTSIADTLDTYSRLLNAEENKVFDVYGAIEIASSDVHCELKAIHGDTTSASATLVFTSKEDCDVFVSQIDSNSFSTEITEQQTDEEITTYLVTLVTIA